MFADVSGKRAVTIFSHLEIGDNRLLPKVATVYPLLP
jgi:hypothetical protein